MRRQPSARAHTRRANVLVSVALISVGLAGQHVLAQDGDSSSRGSQSGSSSSGDAIGGGQVVRSRNKDGNVNIYADNRSENATAETGKISGSNSFNGVVVGDFVSEPSTHSGDVVLVATETAEPPRSSARTAAQRAGSVMPSSVAPVAALGAVAPAVGLGEAAPAELPLPAGPPASSATTPTGVPFSARVDHAGDNTIQVGQGLDLRAGNAVAGSQLISVSNARDVSIRSSNRSSRAEATGGTIDAANEIDQVTAGASIGGGTGPLPPAGFAAPASRTRESGAQAAESGALDALGPARTDGSIQRAPAVDAGSRGSFDSTTGAAPSAVRQDGDNRFVWRQTGAIDGGDALAGASVIGVLARGAIEIDSSNRSSQDSAVIQPITLEQTVKRVRLGSRIGALGPVGPESDEATSTSDGSFGPLGALGPGFVGTQTDALGGLGPVGPDGNVTVVAIQEGRVLSGEPTP